MMHGQKNIKLYYWEYVCSLSYTARKAHAQYYIANCSLSVPNVFFHIVSKNAQFQEKFTEYKMCVLIFSANFVTNISYYKKKWARNDHKCVVVFI